MNGRHVFKICVVTVLAVIGIGSGLDKAALAQQGQADFEQGVEVLTRGPVHEAFAETVTFDPRPGMVAAKAPPNAIEELPPDQRPEGDNVAWIPGYWGWDDERTDYLWVSGIWRALPPGRQWVPGYWSTARQGAQWTSGYWADAGINEVAYLPQPPQTIEAGPNIAAPSANYGWVPGCWVWHQGRFAWRPGYWETVQPNWLWVPAHYVWSPRGYVFVEGYWDYSVGHRGVLFAPVYFDAAVYRRPGFAYSPRTVIDLNVFSAHLFLRPRYQHYYFGDYYAPSYRTSGFYASFSFNSTRHGYDPIYAHQRWENRGDNDWERRVRTDFRHRRDHEDARPPRTLTAQVRISASTERPIEKRSPMVGVSFDQLAKRKDNPTRFQPVAQPERQQLVQRGQEVQKFRAERQTLEINAVRPSAEKASTQAEPTRVRLSRSPIVAKSVDQLGKDRAPPKPRAAPTPDLKVTPAPRKTVSAVKPHGKAPKAKKDEPSAGPQDFEARDKSKQKSKE